MVLTLAFLIIGCSAQYAPMPIPSVDRPACDAIDERSMEIWTAVELKNNDDNLREFFIPPTVSRLFASELEQCAAACACTEDCMAFTYHPGGQQQNNCWLKSNVVADLITVRKLNSNKAPEERSATGIKCEFRMSQAIEDALTRPGDSMSPEGIDVDDVCSAGVDALTMKQTSTVAPVVEVTTKQENIQIQTTAFNPFTFGEEITNPEDKKEEVVTEENLTKTTDVMDEVDIIEEEKETTVNSTIVNSTTVNSETTFSASGDTFTTDPPMRTRDRKLSRNEIAAVVIGSIVGAGLIGGVIAVAVVQAKDIQAQELNAGKNESSALNENNNNDKQTAAHHPECMEETKLNSDEKV